MNCNINTYISNNYYELLKISNKITNNHQLSQELLHEVVLQLYEKDEIKLKKYDDKNIKYFITAILRINFYSKTSRFYYNIRKEAQTYLSLFNDKFDYEEESIETNDEIQIIQHAFDIVYEDEQLGLEKENYLCILEEEYGDLEWIEKSLFDLYIVHGSLKKVSKQTRIPVTSVARMIKEIKNKIITNINNRLV